MRNLLLLGVGLFLSLQPPQALAAPGGNAVPTSTGTPATLLKVRVVQNGKPLPHWRVRVSDLLPQAQGLYNMVTTLTGPDGSITLQRFSGRDMQVEADPPWGGNTPKVQKVKSVSDAVNEVTVEFKTGRIAGTARLLSIPVPGALLTLFRTPGSTAPPNNYFKFADSKGRFILDVPPGEYTAQIGFQSQTVNPTPVIWMGKVTVKQGETQILDPKPTLRNPAMIYGYVTKGGKPLPELYLSVSASGASVPMTQILLSEKGHYLLPVSSGSFVVEVSDFPITADPYEGSAATFYASKSIVVKPGSRNRLDIELNDRYLEGTVTRFGAPLEGIRVQAQPGWEKRIFRSFPLIEETRTDAQGKYRLPLSPGDYSIQFLSPAGQQIRLVSLRQTEQKPTYSFDWKPGYVTGVVKDKDGNPVPNYPLSLTLNGAPVVRTGPDGSFAFDAGFSDGGSRFALYGGDLGMQNLGSVIARPGGETKLNPTLRTVPARLEIQVRQAGSDKDHPGPPLPHALVMIEEALRFTDDEGRVSLAGLSARSYKVSVLPTSSSTSYLAPQPQGLISKSVTLKPGDSQRLDLSLAAGWLNVKVRVGKKAVIPDFLLVKKLNDRSNAYFGLPPDTKGVFSALLPEGPYVVEYAPGPEVIVPGISPQLASRIVQAVEIHPGKTSEVQLAVNRLDPAWITDLGPSVNVRSGVTLVGDLALIGLEDGALAAIQAKGPAQGTELWRYPLNAALLSKPLAVGNRVFALTADGNLHAFDITSSAPPVETAGFPLWNDPNGLLLQPAWSTSGRPESALDGKIVLTQNGSHPRLILVDGRTAETTDLPFKGEATDPALPTAEGYLLNLEGNRTVALSRAGEVLWERQFDVFKLAANGPISWSPNGRTLLRGTDAGTVEALSPGDGTPPARWPKARLLPSLNPSSVQTRFEGIRDEVVPTADGQMLLAPAGDLGLVSLITSNGQLCPTWPWTTQDPFGMQTITPYRYLNSPTDLMRNDGKEILFAPAFLRPTNSRNGVPSFGGQPDFSDYGVLLRIPMENPGNDYDVFYGDATDHFVGSPAVTGNTAGDVALAVTENGRLYAFPVR